MDDSTASTHNLSAKLMKKTRLSRWDNPSNIQRAQDNYLFTCRQWAVRFSLHSIFPTHVRLLKNSLCAGEKSQFRTPYQNSFKDGVRARHTFLPTRICGAINLHPGYA